MKNYNASQQAAARELLARRNASQRLIDFVRYTKPDYRAGRFHEALADALDAVLRGDIRNLMVEAPPQHGKTELTTRRLPAYAMGRKPDSRIIVATYNADWAGDLGRDVRDVVASQECRNVFPALGLRPDSKAAHRWQTDQGGYFIAAGVGTSLTGRGAGLGIIDDPFKDRKEADSEIRRQDVWNWYVSVFLTRLSKHAPKIIINTRWHEDDLSGRVLEKAKETGEHWERIQLPAISVIDGEEQALWPEEKPLEWLHMQRATMGARDWLALYQQQPTAEDGTFFKREWFRYYSELPEHLNIYMSGDFAVTEGDGDWTELAVWGVDPQENVYVLDWWSGQASSDRWIAELIARFKRWEPLWFIGEAGPIRRAVEPMLLNTMRAARVGCAIEWLASSQNKQANARPFQALQSMGRVYWPKLDWAERAIDQLLKFPAGKNDDAVDTCSLFGRYMQNIWGAAMPPEPAEVKTEVTTWRELMKPTRREAW